MTTCENLALFIGGPWDGRRRVVYDRVPFIYVSETVPPSLSSLHFPDGCEPPAKPAHRQVRYWRVVLDSVPHTALYVLDSIRGFEALMDALVVGYRLPRERS